MGRSSRATRTLSALVQRILDPEPRYRMPPPEAKKTLSEAEKQTLVRWIREGAKYEPHWSFVPPVRPEPPAVKNAAWVRNPIDRFLLARIEAEGLAPAPEADRRVLVRRVALDLTGLPPSPEVVESFVRDTSDGAYEKLVDRLTLLAGVGRTPRAATGWTAPGTPTRTATISITTARCGRIANG